MLTFCRSGGESFLEGADLEPDGNSGACGPEGGCPFIDFGLAVGGGEEPCCTRVVLGYCGESVGEGAVPELETYAYGEFVV